MKWPNRRLCRSSHASTSLGSSGAVPYSMLSNFSTMLIRVCSILSSLCDRVPVLGGVTSGDVVLELPLDVGQHAAGAEAEHLRPQPGVAEFFLHQRPPFQRLFGRADTAGGLEARSHVGFLRVFAVCG